nr:unnamed protein product [Callosobruchus analis]
MSEEEIKLDFLDRADLHRLMDVLRIPPEVVTDIVNKMVNVLMENHSECLDKLNAVQWLNRDQLEFYAEAIHSKGAPMTNCWGFIDGTPRKIC